MADIDLVIRGGTVVTASASAVPSGRLVTAFKPAAGRMEDAGA